MLKRRLLIGVLIGIIVAFFVISQSISQETVYKKHHKKLRFSGVDLEKGPHFYCPNCGHDFFVDAEWEKIKASLGTVGDFNQLVTFKCPCIDACGAEFSLYVALHKYPDGSIAIQIQKSSHEGKEGIPEDWWTEY